MIAADSGLPGAGARTIRARGLARRFGERQALYPTDLDVGPGGITGLLGPNGSGKSTLLRMLTGLVRPDAGSAEVDGVAVRGDGTAIRRRASYAPGEIGLYGDLSGREHLAWLLRGREPEARERALRVAEHLELPLKKKVHTYSHGMKRQLLFSAALAPRVGVRILDEISEGLDPNKRSTVLALLVDDARSGTTILLSSHHLAEVESVCRTFIFLNAGRCVAVEDAARLAERAARVLRVRYARAADEATLAAARAATGLAVELRDGALVIELAAADPRPALAALARAALPAPLAVHYGELSLREVYRDLYGVEAC